MASALGLPGNVARPPRSSIGALGRDLLPAVHRGVSTSSLYAAARQAGTPRSLDRIAAVSRVEKGRKDRPDVPLRRSRAQAGDQPADPELRPRFASDLGLSDEAERRASLLNTARNGGAPLGQIARGARGPPPSTPPRFAVQREVTQSGSAMSRTSAGHHPEPLSRAVGAEDGATLN